MKPCTDEEYDYYANVVDMPYLNEACKILVSVAALIGTAIVFGCNKWKGTPWLVVFFWVMIDVAAALDLISGITWKSQEMLDQSTLS